jgi:cytochrome bd-type quinol oxidase subunit 1
MKATHVPFAEAIVQRILLICRFHLLGVVCMDTTMAIACCFAWRSDSTKELEQVKKMGMLSASTTQQRQGKFCPCIYCPKVR